MKELMKKEKQRLEDILAEVGISLSSAPEGSLRISKNGNNGKYYHVLKEHERGRYLRRDETELVRALAQKDYDQRIQKAAQGQLHMIEKLNRSFTENDLGEIYESLNPLRKSLIKPYEKTDLAFAEEWMKKPYQRKEFDPMDDSEFYTRKGERVRSKTEIQIADRMLDRTMWYKVEAPVDCGKYGILYPDFTILLPKTRRVVYWEHCGKMDDPKYLNDFFWKMQIYPKSGIIPGDNLYMTFERKDNQISTIILENVIEAIMSADEI